MKTHKAMDLMAHGHRYVCIKHLDTNRNPFWLYELEWKDNKNGYPYQSKKLLVKYQDMDSVLFHLLQLWGYPV